MEWWVAILIVLGSIAVIFMLLGVIASLIITGQISRELGDK